MAQIHIRLHGTQEEVRRTLQEIKSNSDAVLERRRLFPHMTQYLGVEIWEVVLSKGYLSEKAMRQLHSYSREFPKMLYRVTNVNNELLCGKYNPYTNYAEADPDYPGPFGALCKIYGLPSYLTHHRNEQGEIERTKLNECVLYNVGPGNVIGYQMDGDNITASVLAQLVEMKGNPNPAMTERHVVYMVYHTSDSHCDYYSLRGGYPRIDMTVAAYIEKYGE